MGEPAEKMDDAPRVSKLKVLKGQVKLAGERIAMSNAGIKAESVAKETGKAVCEASGFFAWQLGRLVRPLRRKWRQQIEQYKKEMGEK